MREPPKFETLKHCDEIEMFWHWNPMSFEFSWKRGKVWRLLSGDKMLVPHDGTANALISRHRNDQIRWPE